MDEIAHYPDPFENPDEAGRIELVPKSETMQGFRCPDITAEYTWHPNGPGHGFTQTLMCRFDGSVSNFNHMMRTIQNHDGGFIVLLPQNPESYLIIGNNASEIELSPRAVEHKTFVLECSFSHTSFPFYVGKVKVTNVKSSILMERLFNS